MKKSDVDKLHATREDIAKDSDCRGHDLHNPKKDCSIAPDSYRTRLGSQRHVQHTTGSRKTLPGRCCKRVTRAWSEIDHVTILNSLMESITDIAHCYDVHVMSSSRLLVGATTNLFDISVTLEAKRTVEPTA